MFRTLSPGFENMTLALVLWLCVLPLIGLLIAPFFGVGVAALTALVLLVAAIVACWGICSWEVFTS